MKFCLGKNEMRLTSMCKVLRSINHCGQICILFLVSMFRPSIPLPLSRCFSAKTRPSKGPCGRCARATWGPVVWAPEFWRPTTECGGDPIPVQMQLGDDYLQAYKTPADYPMMRSADASNTPATQAGRMVVRDFCENLFFTIYYIEIRSQKQIASQSALVFP